MYLYKNDNKKCSCNTTMPTVYDILTTDIIKVLFVYIVAV